MNGTNKSRENTGVETDETLLKKAVGLLENYAQEFDKGLTENAKRIERYNRKIEIYNELQRDSLRSIADSIGAYEFDYDLFKDEMVLNEVQEVQEEFQEAYENILEISDIHIGELDIFRALYNWVKENDDISKLSLQGIQRFVFGSNVKSKYDIDLYLGKAIEAGDAFAPIRDAIAGKEFDLAILYATIFCLYHEDDYKSKQLWGRCGMYLFESDQNTAIVKFKAALNVWSAGKSACITEVERRVTCY